MSINHAAVDRLIDSMSFTQKVGQLNQRLFGWKSVERNAAGRLVASDELKQEIDRWGGLGALYGLLRADPWSGQHWGNGIRPEERPEAVAVVQQTVLERGAHGIGVLLSEEAPHGHQALGGTVLPTNLGLGATFDSQGVQEAEAAVAAELAASGIHIALVSGLDIARDPRWGRCEECFGEDPLMASRMCEAIVTGMQGEHRSKVGHGGVAVVLKHLAAQGEAVGGRNGQSAVLGPHDLHEIHLPPVAAGVRAGALGFMAAYNDIDSVPCCANPWLLKDYLRDQLGFDGIVMADGLAVDRLEDMAGSIPAAGRAALLAGVDVSLWDEGFARLEEYVDDEQVAAAVDTALRRVLELKAMFGLLPEDGADTAAIAMPDADAIAQATADGREQAKRMAREAITLINDGRSAVTLDSIRGVLTDAQAGPVIVAGPFADDFGCFLGDYTAPLPADEQSSIYRQLVARLGKDRVCLAAKPSDVSADRWASAAAVVFVCGSTSERSYDSEFDDNGAAKAVAEYGATCGEGVDLSDIRLPWHQDEMLDEVVALTTAPVVSVVVCGRAHVLTHVIGQSAVTIWVGYAGQYGPQAVADVLIDGAGLPGRLPVTLPAHPAAIPVRYNDRQSAAHVYKDAAEPVLREFGYGAGSLAGVTFSGMHADAESRANEVLVQVTAHAGDHKTAGSVNLFAHVSGGRRIPRLAVLVDSVALTLEAGESHAVSFSVPFERLMDEADDNVRVTFALTAALNNDDTRHTDDCDTSVSIVIHR
ncbi:glycoside hydrolase family 3 C-terminal domain-containing protein [Bifidobacterium longum]|uniref:glycoside hydrolase family 3 protein n=1 Tax=Bifidobacterium longum TaxID=216816 RepID=UPI0018AA9348|nr:glycoside hydrolase family 3 N-terminal domain-containing protein [Bifidobacterium longum]MDB6575325.1 glycoside hydrolase family 3 C-terminal domain-containing protein [Bifidobacterium longum]MDB6887113.1 glycoside hydrolase family 3 C-terminal domain-containing protein [Bifidobacterium longum]MDB6892280.1 glycoside hydrolase family 3 C-terminal domain-containing protein [Bifidobacterium longum]MDB6896427.1 glycoside hydrolase family 3 C-terminal domain-containing protein [Bifidobacterium l